MLEAIPDYIAAVASVLAAFIGWRVLRIERDRQRRRPLIAETRVVAEDAPPGWQTAIFVVRNLEPVGARITGVSSHAPGVTLAEIPGSFVPGNPTAGTAKALNLLVAHNVRHLSVSYELAPFANVSASSRGNSDLSFRCWVHGPCRPNELEVHWAWADGAPH